MNHMTPRALSAIYAAFLLAALIAVFGIGVFVAEAPAAEPRSVTSTFDTKIVQNLQDKNYGALGSLSVDGDVGSGADEAALIKWDLAGIAPGTSVNSASITLNVTSPSAQTYEAYKLKPPWAEDQANWNMYAGSQRWERSGAKGVLDRESAVAGVIKPSAKGRRTFSVSASVVQGWVDNPASNQGIVIDDSGNSDGFTFRSGESSDISQRPQLTINLGDPAVEPPPGGEDPILVGAGDIADCSTTTDEATARLLDNTPGTIYTTGDNVYNSGTSTEFRNCYGPTWGRHKGRTKPTPGNHDYHTAGASGYYDYFGASAGTRGKGYYSYDLGGWHVVALNSSCQYVGGCSETSPMLTWLKQDLAANPKPCTVAYWHHPLFSSGEHGNSTIMKPAYQILYDKNADVILTGHDHDYERFAPQNPNGGLDTARGMRQFVVGTGGTALRSFGAIRANSQARNASAHGVLKLTLHSGSYDWKFLSVAGKTFTDSGSTSCH